MTGMDDREERLAQALRANLHRRKAQSRARRSSDNDQTGQSEDRQSGPMTADGVEQDHGQAED
jgi:hypothetical protein